MLTDAKQMTEQYNGNKQIARIREQNRRGRVWRVIAPRIVITLSLLIKNFILGFVTLFLSVDY